AANVPIVKGVEPPSALFEIDRTKIVGLTIDPERLADIREERVRSMGAPRRRYADLEAVFEELETASRVHRRLRCPVIDVSELSVGRPRCGSCASSANGVTATRACPRERPQRPLRAARPRDRARSGGEGL